MSVSHIHMYLVHAEFRTGLQNSSSSITSPGTGVGDICAHYVGARNQTRFDSDRVSFVALTVLELSMLTRLTWNTQISLCLFL